MCVCLGERERVRVREGGGRELGGSAEDVVLSFFLVGDIDFFLFFSPFLLQAPPGHYPGPTRSHLRGMEARR